MTLNRNIANFRGHYVSHERTFRGHLKKSRAKSPFFEAQGKPCCPCGSGRSCHGEAQIYENDKLKMQNIAMLFYF